MVTLVILEGYLLARIVPMSQEKVPSYHWSISGMPESSNEEIHVVGRRLYSRYMVIVICE